MVGGEVLEVGYLGEETGGQHGLGGFHEGVGHFVVLVLGGVSVYGGAFRLFRGPFDVGVLFYEGGAFPSATYHGKLFFLKLFYKVEEATSYLAYFNLQCIFYVSPYLYLTTGQYKCFMELKCR